MANSSSLLVLDLSSYGSALAIINQFCDDKSVQVFEVSPLGTAGLLILDIKDPIAGTLLKNDIFSIHKNFILSYRLIEEYDLQLLKVYLSQNKPEIQKHLFVQEFSFVSEALAAAKEWMQKSIQLVDLRVIRTFPTNIILTVTTDDFEQLLQLKNLGGPRTSTLIENVEPSLRQYF